MLHIFQCNLFQFDAIEKNELIFYKNTNTLVDTNCSVI